MYIPLEDHETIKRIFIRSLNEKKVRTKNWRMISQWIEEKIEGMRKEKITYVRVESIQDIWTKEFFDAWFQQGPSSPRRRLR